MPDATKLVTDDELREFLALDDARTRGEWGVVHRHIDCGAMDDEELGLGLELTGVPQPMKGQFARGADASWIAACTRIARAVVEELLERRANDAWTSEYMRQIHAEEAD